MSKPLLRIIDPDNEHVRDTAKRLVKRHRKKAHVYLGGLLVGERINHRGWPPEVVRAFLNALIVKPAEGEIRRKLYG